MRNPIVPALIFLGGASAACQGLRDGANPEVPHWVHRPSNSLHVTYSRNLMAPSREEGEAFERGQPEIDARGRRVFVGSSDGGLYALDASDGHTLWRFETLGPVQSEPLYDPKEDVVYFGSNDGALYKVRAKTGDLLWRLSTSSEVSRRPTLRDGTLYAVNANDTVLALEAATGEVKWAQHRAPAAGMEVAGHSGALVWRRGVYFAYSDGTVAAYDASSGAELWPPVDSSAETEQELGNVPKYLDVDATPVGAEVDGVPLIFTGAYEGAVFALDAETGSDVWSNPDVHGVSDLHLWSEPGRPADATHPAVPARRYLLATTGTTGIWALNPASGTRIWHRDKLWHQDLPGGGVSRPVEVLGALLVSTSQHGLFLLSPKDGSVIDGIHSDLGFSMTPAALGSRAFIVTNGGQFLALSVEPPAGVSQPRSSW